MRILKIEQDTDEWMSERRGSIGGSDAKKVMPIKGGARSAGFWDKVAERLTSQEPYEDPRNRGHRLEEDAVSELSTITGLEFDLKPGLWRTDEDDSVHISADGAEPGDKPTYDAEVKALNGGKHFKCLYARRHHLGSELDLVPNEAGAYYKEQVLHAFVVNEHLQTRYFMLYNPDAIHQDHRVVLMVINRSDIQDELDEYEQKLNRVRVDIDNIVNELAGDAF